MKHEALFSIIVVLSFFGIILTSYLLYVHYSKSSTTLCLTATAEENSCDIVNKGPFSEIEGIPIAGIGLIGYIAFFLIGLNVLFQNKLQNTWLDAHAKKASNYVLLMSLFAFGFTLYLNYLQIFVIEYICFWCEVSATIIVLLIVTSIMIKKNAVHEHC
ncbi:vitamin K epoxide reductase family protein [Candidatus Woesearchaeota archaeon]|nr:vitamin K epoxide reductase family protein [Candidatus Woesearchaeota archaeon]